MDELTEQVALLTNKVTQLEEKLDNLLQKRTESYYQRRLQPMLGGGHAKTKHGISDIETDTTIYEIKQFKNYKQVVGQLKAYNVDNNKKMVAILFGNVNDTQKNETVAFLNKEGIYAMEVLDLPNGEISLIELGVIITHENHQVNIYKWFEENIEYDYGSKLSLKDISLSFFGSQTIGVKQKAKFKKQIECCIKQKFINIQSICQKTTINKESFQGWFHIKLKKDLSFQLWLDKHIVYKEGSILRLKDVCQDFVGTELHSSISSTFKKELEHWIKEKYKHVK